MVLNVRDDWQCHHRFELKAVIHHRYNPRVYRFRCTKCHDVCETTRRKIWHPTKLVPLTERNARELAKTSPMYSAEDLLNILREQYALGRTSVWLNLERQLDGSWLNKAFDDSEEL